MDWQRVPRAWFSSRKTPVAETVIGTSDDAHRCVVRSESAVGTIIAKSICHRFRYTSNFRHSKISQRNNTTEQCSLVYAICDGQVFSSNDKTSIVVDRVQLAAATALATGHFSHSDYPHNTISSFHCELN